MKLQRHAAILRLVRGQRITSQDELRKALKAADFTVTQATLSRDVRELGLAKLTDAQGSYYAQPGDSGVRPGFQAVVGALVTGVDGVGPLLVLRTANGSAGAVAVAVDLPLWRWLALRFFWSGGAQLIRGPGELSVTPEVRASLGAVFRK